MIDSISLNKFSTEQIIMKQFIQIITRIRVKLVELTSEIFLAIINIKRSQEILRRNYEINIRIRIFWNHMHSPSHLFGYAVYGNNVLLSKGTIHLYISG